MTNKEIIKASKNLFKVQFYDFDKVSKIFPITTENVKEMYNIFDLKNKDILTVTSSSDHIFCALVAGANSVDSFDINYLTEYYYHLKKAIIESLTLDEAKTFFENLLHGYIDYDMYLKCHKKMDDKS